MAGIFDVGVIGGGLGGLVTAIDLARRGHSVQLFEKKTYPFQRVCGEYISNEVIPYLERLGCYPHELHPSKLSNFSLTSPGGNLATMPLDLGGFGISRYAFDAWLVEKAREAGVQVHEGTSVHAVRFTGDGFEIEASSNITARLVVGAFGKRSLLESSLARPSFRQRSAYVGVKYHVYTEMPKDLIALHNFEGGYCGVSAVEDGKFNVCYLVARKILRQHGDIPTLEKHVLHANPHLVKLLTTAERITPPVAVNEVSFHAKESIHNHILMVGDAAGMITPLCGNGMALAIHGAKLAAEHMSRFLTGSISRQQMEYGYASRWRKEFHFRLQMGRTIQQLFGRAWLSNLAVGIVKHSQPLANLLMRSTHGDPIQ